MATTSTNRIFSLDMIRGVAVMGIFSVNVIAFAMIEAAYFNPPAYGGWHGADLGLWATNMLVIDGKMRTLFSMLFGASTLLVIERAEAAGLSGPKVHIRRMLVLLCFGLIHYYLIWFGDILTLYATSGLIAFLFRRLPVYRLVALGSAFLLGSMMLFSGFIFTQYQADIAAHAPGATQAAIREWNDGLGNFFPTAAEIAKDRALHLGSWLEFVRHNLAHWTEQIGQTLVFMPETIGLMLLGMAGYKSGFLTGDWADADYTRIASIAIPIGLAAGAAIIAYDVLANFYIIGVFVAFIILATPFITIMAFGYAALIILLSRRHGWIAQRIAAAGRCAFTNYLGTSLIATFIFYGWGLGYYGSLSRWQAWLLVPLVWAVMLAWSKPWLEHFEYGPLEWAWRSLSRGQLQAMRRKRSRTLPA
ncbi:DUF418 domain-containing protein [Sphingomonas sp. RB56-2]|uniref:DUF418 domain-containing protein n=1 Tax=Sphingomonas brevis TaxID=2908206 RepID=A0ABT0S574_9SPHN|nr:DUF418 domain-containing protein [Sphingomonas brevis]MCL6739549.1 DUF418 domain-containing protein [Sphingomonas brevis]